MKKRVIFVIALLGLSLSALASPAQGHAATTPKLCHASGSYCVVPGTTNFKLYTALWTSTKGNWHYVKVSHGSVKSSTFKNKTVDSYYLGKPTYTIELNSNHHDCIGASAGTVEITPCSGGTGILWVYTPGKLLINIHATNASTSGAHPKAMTGTTASSHTITTTNIDSKSIGRQEWVFKY